MIFQNEEERKNKEKEFLNFCRVTKAERTHDIRQTVLREYAPFEFSIQGLTEYIDACYKKGNSWNTLARVKMTALRNFLEFIKNQENVYEVNRLIEATKGIKEERTIQTFATEEQVLDILDHTKKLEHKAIIALCFYQAMRISEALNLKAEDVTNDGIIVHHTKTNSDRFIPFTSPIVHRLVLEQKNLCDMTNAVNLFNVKKNSMQVAFKRTCRKLGYNDLHMHSLRAGFVTKALEENIDLPSIMELTGHKSLNAVQYYVHCTPKMREKAKSIFSKNKTEEVKEMEDKILKKIDNETTQTKKG